MPVQAVTNRTSTTATSAHPTLRVGSKGREVESLQRLLASAGYDPGRIDGTYGLATKNQVRRFQLANGLEGDGVAGPATWAKLQGNPTPPPSNQGGAHGVDISAEGKLQMKHLLDVSRRAADGKKAKGWCYRAVKKYLTLSGFGNLVQATWDKGYNAVARNFHEFMQRFGPENYGMQKLNITNPFDAPAGSVVVMKPGSPGTHHPTAGDISIANGSGKFFNDGTMRYGGDRRWFERHPGYVLGVYAPL